VRNPTLWYPNNSIYGKPNMYRVYHSVNGTVVDVAQSPLGIRTLTCDNNFPYFNGHQQYLWGASGRYDYPGLGLRGAGAGLAVWSLGPYGGGFAQAIATPTT